jgi:hypothetical protein
VSITSAPAEGTRTDRNVSYAWQGSGGSGTKQYSYYLEGWSLDSNVLVVYESGFNAAREPAWGPWTTATQAAYTLRQPGHYTFHVQAMDSLGQVSMYQDSRTLLADVTALQSPIMALGAPAPHATVQQPFLVAGWAIDQAAAQGPGVDAVHVYAYPSDASGAITGAPRFLGVAAMGGSRPDVGAIYGEQFTNSGFGLWASALPSGFYRLVVYARSTITGSWQDSQRVFWVPPPAMALGVPAPNATVQQPFLVAGWAIDQAAAQGPGVDAVHVYAYPSDASGAITGAPRFLGVAAMGGSRPDVGAIYGEQFTNSGFGLWASALPSGFYRLVVYARSTITGSWQDSQRVFQVPAS